MLTLQGKQSVLFLQDIHIDISRAIYTLLFIFSEVIFMKKNLFIMMSQYGELLNRVGSYNA